MTAPRRSLPSHPSLDHQKTLAKELCAAFRAGDIEATARIRQHLPDKQYITLADAQFVLAREYGFGDWARLKAHILAAHAEVLTDSTQAEFQRAFHSRDAAALRKLLQRHPAAHAAINAPLFPFGSPALVHIAGSGDVAMVDVLLEFGADPNRRSDWWAGGWHALHSASDAVAERLLAAGAVPDACAAAHLDDLALLRTILDADPSRVHERGGDGQTPLHFARSREVADLLLERGADPDARDLDHRGTPAQWMLQRRRGAGRYDLAAYLVERGATADIFLAAALGRAGQVRAMLQQDASLLNQRTGQGEFAEQPPSSLHIYTWTIGQNLSPFQVAAQFEQVDVLEVLRDVASPRERFVAACVCGHAAEARRLLQERPELMDEITATDARVLPDAGWAGDAAAVDLMLELGFDARAEGQDRGTVLHCAAWIGSAACVEAALRYPSARALVNASEPTHGATPLGWCCHGARHCGDPKGDYPRVAQLLLEAGARADVSLEEVPAAVRAVIEGYARSS